ncbi:MAG: DNA methyltransferase [Chloroflexi bacterium]|nr:DNA methyltransferase [Chloroflexota bacterium]
MPPNWVNRTLWTGDNLDILRGMNSECVDLIYLDPPFNSNQDYAAPVGSEAAGAAFKDTWTLSDLDVAWMGLIADEQPAIADLLDTAGRVHGKGMQSYLTMMAVRLLEMRRVLKTTGSIYLHCDPTASHYLKALLDGVFGRQHFRNEIIWKRTFSHGGADGWGSVHDTLLFYSRSERFRWTGLTQEYDPAYVAAKYSKEDDRGRYQAIVMTGPGTSQGPSGQPWQGYDPTAAGRHWAVPRAALATLRREGIPIPTDLHARLDLLMEHGFIYIPQKAGGVPRFKRYLGDDRVLPVQDVIADVPPINSQAKERIGYPTQKPLALLERIIQASSDPGDMVLDPFAGCATACVAAEDLGRQWVGIDLSEKAVELVNRRLQETMGTLFHNRLVTARTDIPRRTDIDAPKNYRQNKHILYGEQEGYCAGCRTHFEFRHLEVDHVIPQRKGGGDHIENLQLLCASCNRIKGDRPQEYLVARLAELAG